MANFNKDKLKRLLGKRITVVTNKRSFTGRLVFFDNNELRLRRTKEGVRSSVVIPIRNINAIVLPRRKRKKKRPNHCPTEE